MAIKPTVINESLKTARTTLSDNWVINVTTKFVFIFFIGSLALIAYRWKLLPPTVPLWYSKPWGEEQLASPLWLFLLPLSSFIWYVLSILIVTYLTKPYRVFSQVICMSSLLVSFLSFVTLLKILFIVT